ncbi:hypothetical protein Baya_16932 [Bagarius yarrelli]|uniref:Uncharacterized protein n=1 Tax=Bagarius yarrelli TaxID=175774 RepID=A0A556VX19_BAGYA|nr:hypothetical protein Baya_16932 [Bagarius yarrelli]
MFLIHLPSFFLSARQSYPSTVMWVELDTSAHRRLYTCFLAWLGRFFSFPTTASSTAPFVSVGGTFVGFPVTGTRIGFDRARLLGRFGAFEWSTCCFCPLGFARCSGRRFWCSAHRSSGFCPAVCARLFLRFRRGNKDEGDEEDEEEIFIKEA